MLELYKRIRQRRELLGMSQDELSRKLGYKSRSSINKIEKGENDIPQSKIVAFAEALDTTPEYLMGWNDRANVASKEETKLLEGFNSLTKEGKAALLTILDSLKMSHSATA